MNMTSIVRDNVVRFVRYRLGYVYYAVTVPGEGEFHFPVDVRDVGSASFGARERAILFMHYIRKAMHEGSFVRAPA